MILFYFIIGVCSIFFLLENFLQLLLDSPTGSGQERSVLSTEGNLLTSSRFWSCVKLPADLISLLICDQFYAFFNNAEALRSGL